MVLKIRKILIIISLLKCQTCIGQSFINGSFESWGQANGCSINIPPDSWSNYTTGGIAPDEANFLHCATTIPPLAANGNIYARCVAYPTGSEGMFQIVSGFIPGENYTISFKYSGSNRFGGSGMINWNIYIDDTILAQTPLFSSLQPFWTDYSCIFTATMLSHKIGLRLSTIDPIDGSGGIDDVILSTNVGIGNINPIATNVKIGPNPCVSSATLYSVKYLKNATLMIYNSYGQLERIINGINGSTFALSFENLSSGLYFLKLIEDNSLISKTQIVIQDKQ